MKTIEHDKDERPGRRYSLGKWWFAVWGFVAVLWSSQLNSSFDWVQIELSFASGLLFGYCVIDFHLSSGGSVRDL